QANAATAEQTSAAASELDEQVAQLQRIVRELDVMVGGANNEHTSSGVPGEARIVTPTVPVPTANHPVIAKQVNVLKPATTPVRKAGSAPSDAAAGGWHPVEQAGEASDRNGHGKPAATPSKPANGEEENL